MKNLLLALFTVFISFALVTPEAEAKRMGGGRSSGMQRQSQPQQATSQQAPRQTGAAAATPQKRSWMGPLAGLAAGLGLAALASHLGFGEEMANFLMMALLALAAFMAIRWFMNRNKPRAPAMQYAANGPMGGAFDQQPQDMAPPMGSANATTATAPTLPTNFDHDAFVRLAKITFIRMQAAHDAGNLNDLREFLSPEMFAEVKIDLDDRHDQPAQTDVLNLEAGIADWSEEAGRQIVSVRYTGQLREDGMETSLNEVWHLVREANTERWVVAGIQQN